MRYKAREVLCMRFLWASCLLAVSANLAFAGQCALSTTATLPGDIGPSVIQTNSILTLDDQGNGSFQKSFSGEGATRAVIFGPQVSALKTALSGRESQITISVHDSRITVGSNGLTSSGPAVGTQPISQTSYVMVNAPDSDGLNVGYQAKLSLQAICWVD